MSRNQNAGDQDNTLRQIISASHLGSDARKKYISLLSQGWGDKGYSQEKREEFLSDLAESGKMKLSLAGEEGEGELVLSVFKTEDDAHHVQISPLSLILEKLTPELSETLASQKALSESVSRAKSLEGALPNMEQRFLWAVLAEAQVTISTETGDALLEAVKKLGLKKGRKTKEHLEDAGEELSGARKNSGTKHTTKWKGVIDLDVEIALKELVAVFKPSEAENLAIVIAGLDQADFLKSSVSNGDGQPPELDFSVGIPDAPATHLLLIPYTMNNFYNLFADALAKYQKEMEVGSTSLTPEIANIIKEEIPSFVALLKSCILLAEEAALKANKLDNAGKEALQKANSQIEVLLKEVGLEGIQNIDIDNLLEKDANFEEVLESMQNAFVSWFSAIKIGGDLIKRIVSRHTNEDSERRGYPPRWLSSLKYAGESIESGFGTVRNRVLSVLTRSILVSAYYERISKEAKKKAGKLEALEIGLALTQRSKYKEFRRKGGVEFQPPKSSEEFFKNYNLRAIEFGNYVEDSRREELLFLASSAIEDLASCLGVPPQALSFSGKLSYSFGARGKGGKRSGMAHYEPVENVIALTKTSGDGTVSHEWAHALDLRGRLKGMTSGNEENPEVLEAVQNVKKEMLYSTKEDYIEHQNSLLEHYQIEKTRNHAYYKESLSRLQEAKAKAMKELAPKLKDLQKKRDEILKEISVNNLDNKEESLKAFLAQAEGELKSCKAKEDQIGFLYNSEVKKIDIYRIKGNTIVKIMSNIKNNISRVQLGYTRDIWRRNPAFDNPAFDGLRPDSSEYLPSPLLENSVRIETSKDPYWSSPEEMFARSFEAYVSSRLMHRGAENNFLVDGVPLRESIFSPYPQGKQKERIEAAMENLVSVLKKNGFFS
jgi:hypothetical protein